MPSISIDGPNAQFIGELRRNKLNVLVGPNGSGKTRLAVEIDRILSANSVPVHRISAHRALILRTDVDVTSLQVAQNFLWYGNRNPETRPSNKIGLRWQNKPATILLNDFDALLQLLAAEESTTSYQFRQLARRDHSTAIPTTSLDRLQTIWEELLPHRRLILAPGSVRVAATANTVPYGGDELSDGERAIFYLLGQVLTAPKECFLIIDEPDLHIHKAVLPKLFDEIEAARQDCTILYLTHDLDFAACRKNAQKLFVSEYVYGPQPSWTIDPIPEDTGFPEQIVTLILGSRQPILFVEGNVDSLDVAVYRHIYTDRTVLPLGGCEAVIEATKAFGRHQRLHHVGAVGLIDYDERGSEELQSLDVLRIKTLTVAEVELLFVTPNIFRAFAAELNFTDLDIQERLDRLINQLFILVERDIESITLKRTKKEMGRRLSHLIYPASTLEELTGNLGSALVHFDLARFLKETKAGLELIIKNRDYDALLKLYGNKGVLAEVAKVLDLHNKKSVERQIILMLGKGKNAPLRTELLKVLPLFD